MSNDKCIDTRPADVRAQANGPWLAVDAIDQDAMDDAMRRPPAGNIPMVRASEVLRGYSLPWMSLIDAACGTRGFDLGKEMKEAEKAALGFPHRNRHISDAAWKALALNSGWSDSVRADCERLYRRSGTVVLSGEEYDELTANQAKGAGLSALCAQKTIANLEAEVESLSRQLRSREINREFSEPKPPFRWSPLL